MSALLAILMSELLVVALASQIAQLSHDPPRHSSRLGGTLTVSVDGAHAFSLSLPTLSREDRRAFSVGNSFFRENWVAAPASADGRDGLGPHFAASSCSACHQEDGRGLPPLEEIGVGRGSVVFVSPRDADGAAHPIYGSQLQDQAIEGVRAEVTIRAVPRQIGFTYPDGTSQPLQQFDVQLMEPAYGPLGEVRLSMRVGPQLIGLGLLEGIPDAAIQALADPDDRDGDGVSGRVHQVREASGITRIGRFGWKASQTTLESQVMAALQGDMGLTNPRHPLENHTESQTDARAAASGGAPEVDAHKVTRLTHYVRALAVPAQRLPSDATSLSIVGQGAAHFQELGCTKCHMTTLRTDSSSPIDSLRNVEFHPFTDLLLHDMGDGLADHRRDGDATGREWRTPPLWGIGLIETVNGHTRLLHDGRARSIEEAILWH
ncbi:MAG: di-heme oxidoredictase family protein, partial [Limnohabitans sp.]|nr:di-heme oxidoredictase family protein [Limnohabitans sp.]